MAILLLDDHFLPQAVALVESAQKSIDVCTFKAEISHKARGRRLKKFFDVLISKAHSGVRVRMLLNWNSDRRGVAMTNLNVMREMKSAGVHVGFLPRDRCCHAKLVIADGRHAIMGSHNLSIRSCHNNYEASIMIEAASTVTALQDFFHTAFLTATKAGK